MKMKSNRTFDLMGLTEKQVTLLLSILGDAMDDTEYENEIREFAGNMYEYMAVEVL